ncbi:MAG: ATP-binding cassette domain-containing protein [Actinomycetaceae bacterium]|nr:ATP-binding cassette domain-containing protein [Actinomycetaceae bacterium]
MPSINVHNLFFSYTKQPLLRDISFRVGDGERAFLIGPNGCGKSTLLNIILGIITPDSGSVTISDKASINAALPALMASDANLSEHSACDCVASANFDTPIASPCSSVQDYVDSTFDPIYSLLRHFEQLTSSLTVDPACPSLAKEYDTTLAALTAIDAWSLETRIDETLAGLGLSHLAGSGRKRRLDTLSPGQIGRVELAMRMIACPSVLILDEPTNHLDHAAIHFLERQLRNWEGPALIASHDRAFIEGVGTVIYDLDIAPWQALSISEGGAAVPGVYRCAGAYSDYLQSKEHAKAEHRRIHAEQRSLKRDIKQHRRESLDISHGGIRVATAEGKARKFYSDRAAKTSRGRTRSDDRRLNDLREREVRKPRGYELDIGLAPVQASSGGIAVAARDAGAVGRLESLTFDVAYGEHLLVTGGNGSGKSTLLRWIATGRPPHSWGLVTRGSIHVEGHTAFVPQTLPAASDIGDDVWSGGIGAVGAIGAGIVHPSLWKTPIGQLSDGNQRRVQIALAIATKPEIFIIDEPTNYLDLDTMEALERALAAWNGTVIIASHDRWLIDHWSGAQLELGGERNGVC